MGIKDIRKLYVPVDGVKNRVDFPIWYEDGFEFAVVHGESGWKSEKDRVQLLGPSGGQIARIKPDFRALTYDVRVDRWTYVLKTFTIFKHYFFEGMMWKMYGSLRDGKAQFINQNTRKKDVYVYTVNDFKGHGPCYEVRVRDINKLRPAAAAVVSIMIKEDFVGLSLGEGDPQRNFARKLLDFVNERGYTLEEIEKLTAEGRNVIEMPEKEKPQPQKKK